MKKEKNIANKETKALIIDCAGRLIAKYGYPSVTSKRICEEAKVNMAAINYHFGSRDGLYTAVLNETHDFLISIDELNKLYLSDLSAKEKIETFVDIFIERLSNKKNWYLKVWAREIVNPSPFIKLILSKETLLKLSIVSKIFSEYIELPITDLRLYSCILSSVSPFIITFLAHGTFEHFPVKFSEKDLVSHLKKILLFGLDEFKKYELKYIFDNNN